MVRIYLVLLLLSYGQLSIAAESRLATRIDRISQQWLGKPYLSDPLGEGDNARYDRDPRFRLDAFDCTTFVESTIAVAKSRSQSDILPQMDRVRYSRGRVDFVTRNHIPGLDWIQNNIENGTLRDITVSIGKNKTKIAEAVIERDEWYQMLKPNRLSGIPETERESRLAELHRMGQTRNKEIERVPYLSKEDVVGNPSIVTSIPHGSVINIVRPNWDLRKLIGTRINISHQGLAIHRNGIVYFRHASQDLKVVTEEPLASYMRRTLASETIQGINILAVEE